jgi:hypothetical protein
MPCGGVLVGWHATLRIIVSTFTVWLVVFGPGSPAAQDLFVYPAKGQSEEQSGRDKEECHGWAVSQTGVDPEKLAAEATSAPPSGTGGGLEGAGVGAARGAMSGEAGAGAIRGIGIGRLVRAVRARQQMEEQHQAATQGHEQRQAQLQKYDRAYTACLTRRGYTVQ